MNIYKRGAAGFPILIEDKDEAIKHILSLLKRSERIKNKMIKEGTIHYNGADIDDGMLSSQVCLLFEQHPDGEGYGNIYD